MSIAKIEPTTKVKDWVKRINYSFEEIRRREIYWQTVSVAGVKEYNFAALTTDSEEILKTFDVNYQYSVQYGGVVLLPEDYKLSGTTLTFVNGAPMEDGYPIIVRWIGRGREQASLT